MIHRHIILGTAGHIDHGKTSLIRALTGIDTDRLPEEKERGITIELGFAHLELSESIHAGIVDVPGHEKFVHHMVAGVGGMDFVMMVIAADEGIMPQTREHIAICDLLGVRKGMVALTKIDMVDSEWLELVQEDVRDYLSGTFLANAPIIPVSAVTGAGINDVKRCLCDLAETVRPRQSAGPFRLPIDRVFTIRGFGTVVTGTVSGGGVSDGESLQIVPGGQPCKIRGLQVHGAKIDRIVAGQRAAVNIQNIAKESIQRGMMLTRPGTIPETRMIDASCRLIPSCPRPLKNRAPIRFHSGTAEILGRIVLMDRDVLTPGNETFVQFRLIEPTANLPGDRFVIRSYSPVMTIGGGTILDAEPVKHKRNRPETLSHFSRLASPDPCERLLAALEAAGTTGLDLSTVHRRFPDPEIDINNLTDSCTKTGRIHPIPGSPLRFLSTRHWTVLNERIIESVANFHRRNPLKPGINREELRTTLQPPPHETVFDACLTHLIHSGRLVEQAAFLKGPDFQTSMTDEQKRVALKMEDIICSAGVSGVMMNDFTDALSMDVRIIKPVLQHLVESGKLVRLPGSLFMAADALNHVADKLTKLLQTTGSITVGAFRDAMDISRKQAVPLLEYFDSIGLTRRKGDVRVLRTVSGNDTSNQ